MDRKEVFADDVGISGAAGHRAAVVMLEDAAGREDERILGTVLFDLLRLLKLEEVELAEAALEAVEVEDRRADPAVGDGPLGALFGEVLPGGAFEEGHDLRNLGEDSLGGVVGLVHPHALHDLGDDDAIRFGALDRGNDGIDALHTALAVGEGATLLEEGRGGQDDVGELAGGRHEELLDDEEVEGV